MITRAVDHRDERENRLSDAGHRGIRGCVVIPACCPVNTRSKDHGIRDVDVLAHLVCSAVTGRGVLDPVEVGAKSNGDRASCSSQGERRAKGDQCFFRHVRVAVVAGYYKRGSAR